MLIKLVLSILTINILMKTTSTQYYANQYYGNMPQQYYQEQPGPQEMDYEEPMDHVHTRRSGRHKKYGSSGGKLPFAEDYDDDESEECNCSCRRCKVKTRPPKVCCREVCQSCSEMQGQQDQGGLFFVPYPYPLLVPNLERNETTVPPTTTTTTTTKKPVARKSDYSEENTQLDHKTLVRDHRKTSAEIINDYLLRSPHQKGEKKYMLTTMRKTKPTWEPKYGIVPIPDNLAEKLMSQLRQIRELQNRRF